MGANIAVLHYYYEVSFDRRVVYMYVVQHKLQVHSDSEQCTTVVVLRELLNCRDGINDIEITLIIDELCTIFVCILSCLCISYIVFCDVLFLCFVCFIVLRVRINVMYVCFCLQTVLFSVCAGNELFYGALYLRHFGDLIGESSYIKLRRSRD